MHSRHIRISSVALTGFFILSIISLHISSSNASAGHATLSADIVYSQGEFDDTGAGGIIIRRMVRRLLRQKLTDYLKEEPLPAGQHGSGEDTQGIASYCIIPEITHERLDDKSVRRLSARIDIDAEETLIILSDIRRDPPRLREFVELEKKADGLMAEAERVDKGEGTRPGRTEYERRAYYSRLINDIAAIDQFQNGHALLLADRFEEAVGAFDRALALAAPAPYIYNGRGLAKTKAGRPGDALPDFDRAVELNPRYAWAYNNRGIAHAAAGNLKQAADDFKKAFELDERYAEAHYNLGLTLASLGDLQGAADEYTKAIGIDRTYNSAYINRGVVLDALGRYKEALADYGHVLEQNPKRPKYAAELHYNRALVYAHADDPRVALKEIEKALVLYPGFTSAHTLKGMVHLHIGETMRAIDEFTEVIKSDPKSTDAHKYRGLAYRALHYDERAVEDFSRAVEIDPKYAEVYFLRGETLMGLKMTEKGLADMKTASEMGYKPADDFLRRTRRNVE